MPETTRDTGLHVSMRTLLSIIAGLLIADMLKEVVKNIGGKVYTPEAWWSSALLVTAALMFLVRIVVDNVLYYTDPDAKTDHPVYIARIALIALDLLSYAVCYHIVFLLDSTTRISGEYSSTVARMCARDVFLVEALHFVWCALALRALRTAEDATTRLPLLRDWLALSGSFAFLAAMIWVHIPEGDTAVPLGATGYLFAYSTASAATYITVMRYQYLQHWRRSDSGENVPPEAPPLQSA